MKAEAGRRRQELAGAGWAFLALFFLLAFVSYSPKDPCLFLREGLTGPVRNWMGPAGAVFAGWLFALLGFSAWAVPLGLGFLAVFSFRGGKLAWRERRWRFGLRGAGAAVVAVSAAIFLALTVGQLELGGERFRPGGIIGHGLAFLLAGLLGKAGAAGTVLLVLVVALVAVFDFSLVRAGQKLLDGAFWLRERLGDVIAGWRAGRQRRAEVVQQRTVLEKTKPVPRINLGAAEKTRPAKPRPVAEKKPKQQKLAFAREGEFELPSVDLLDTVPSSRKILDQEALVMNARILESKLRDFGVQGEVVEVHPGPVVTMYEYRPGPGIKINKIVNLADDLAMAVAALSIRIIAPIPGKNVVGIEISNRDRETVYLREIIETAEFERLKTPLPMALGKNTVGEPFVFDLRKAPHLLVAGATGAGKSVGLNSMIMSVLFRSTPREVRMLMIDPKRLELSVYEGIPHLLHPVIADPKDAAVALKWAVAEMERRYRLLAEQGVRHIDAYNRLVGKDPKEIAKEQKKAAKKLKKKEAALRGDTIPLRPSPEGEVSSGTPGEKKEIMPPSEPLPLIMIVIDELADLMMVAPRDVEESICRLAQMARAAGIHLILATQRPSVDVLTGLIKANFPSRIAFKVSSKVDSRTILDQNGAERLLGQGDMLFLGPGTTKLLRLHGAFVSDQEIHALTEFLRQQGRPAYNEEILQFRAALKDEAGAEAVDEKWEEAVAVAVQAGQISVSMLQRKLKIGYNRAARIIEQMETQGLVGPADGVKPRPVLIDAYQALEHSLG